MNKETNDKNSYAAVSVVMNADMPWKREFKEATKEVVYNAVSEMHPMIYESIPGTWYDNTPEGFADFITENMLVSYSGFLNHVIKTFPQKYADAKGVETDQPYIVYSLALVEPTSKHCLDTHEVKFDETLSIDESIFVDNFNNIDKEAIRSALVGYAKKYIFTD